MDWSSDVCSSDLQLHPIGTLRTEHEDRTAERIEPEHLLHRRRQAVMTLTEVDGPRRNVDPQVPARRDHVAARTARITRDRCPSSTPGAARITISPTPDRKSTRLQSSH